MKKLSVLALLLAGMLAFTAWAEAKEVKIAYIPCGRVNDKSWSEAGYIGAKQSKAFLESKGYKVKLDYTESVPVVKVEAAARDYASRGYNPIILHCGPYVEAALRAAKDHPKTWFLLAAATKSAKNVAVYDPAQHEGSFVVGYLAGLMSKNGRVGAIGGFNWPILARQVEAFRFGARYANPKMKAFHTYINSWEDAAKAKEAALAQIDNGADVIFAATDQAARGAFSAAKARKVFAIASYADQASLAPNTILTSVLYDLPLLIKKMVIKWEDGSLEGKVYKMGMAEGIGALAPYHKMDKVIPAAVKAKVDQLVKDIKSGKVKIPEYGKAGESDKYDPRKVLKGM